MTSKTPVTLSPADVIAAKRAWVTDSNIHCAFKDADSYVAFLRGGSNDGSQSGSSSAASSTPPTPAAVVAKLGRLPTQAELWAAQWAVTPSLRREFSSADSYCWYQSSVARGVISPPCFDR